MILLLAIIIGLAATLVRAKLHHQNLALKRLRWEWLVFVAVIPQLLVFQVPFTGRWIPEMFIPLIQIFSMLGLLVFAVANGLTPGFWAMGLGLTANFLVIILNGGWMPINQETLSRLVPSLPLDSWVIGTRLGFGKDRILAVSDTKLIWLSDCFVSPQWFPYKVAFSLGDVIISIGAVLLLWSLSRKEEEKK